jgi:hypothetical protein
LGIAQRHRGWVYTPSDIRSMPPRMFCLSPYRRRSIQCRCERCTNGSQSGKVLLVRRVITHR